MPKETFFNLPEDKKERILAAATDEFQAYTYHKASISRIVKHASIAKGSFYQYFEDKQDLYKHLLTVSAEKKMEYLMGTLSNINKLPFFELVRALYIAGIKFAQDNPKLAKIADDFVKNTDEKLKEEILGESMPKSNNLFETILRQGIQKEELDPNIDVELVAYMLTSFSVSIGEYFIKEKKEDDDMAIMAFIDKMLYVFENGIKNKEK